MRRQSNSEKAFAGVQFDSKRVDGNGWVLTPYARFSWEHEFSPDRRDTSTFLSLPGSAFTITALPPLPTRPRQRRLQAGIHAQCRRLRILRRRILRPQRNLCGHGQRENPLVAFGQFIPILGLKAAMFRRLFFANGNDGRIGRRISKMLFL